MANVFWFGGKGSWSDAANHWSNNSGNSPVSLHGAAPGTDDNATFDANSGTGTCTVKSGSTCLDFVTTNTSLLTIAGTDDLSVYGNFTLQTGMTYSNTDNLIFRAASGTKTITTNAISISAAINIIANAAATIQLGGNFTTPKYFNFDTGNFDAKGYNLTALSMNITSAGTRNMTLGIGTWTFTGTGNVLNITNTTNLTFNATGSTIIVSDTSATTKAFVGGGQTFDIVTFSGDNITISDNNIFGTLNVNTAGRTNGLKVTIDSIQTVTKFTTNGYDSNLAKMVSSSAGSHFHITTASAQISVNYMSIKDSTADQANTWYAGANSTNVSGNSNWIFTDPPSGGSGSQRSSGIVSLASLQNFKSI